MIREFSPIIIRIVLCLYFGVFLKSFIAPPNTGFQDLSCIFLANKYPVFLFTFVRITSSPHNLQITLSHSQSHILSLFSTISDLLSIIFLSLSLYFSFFLFRYFFLTFSGTFYEVWMILINIFIHYIFWKLFPVSFFHLQAISSEEKYFLIYLKIKPSSFMFLILLLLLLFTFAWSLFLSFMPHICIKFSGLCTLIFPYKPAYITWIFE